MSDLTRFAISMAFIACLLTILVALFINDCTPY